ncbi:MAG: hypothetical protein H5U13_09475 [Parvibaculum sp.]|nr:hypothetical protein [Parvibaculum sp.]
MRQTFKFLPIRYLVCTFWSSISLLTRGEYDFHAFTGVLIGHGPVDIVRRNGRGRLEDEIGVAKADADHADENFVVARFINVQLLNAEPSLGRTRDGSRHLHSPPP